MSLALKTVNWFLLRNAHAKTEKKEGGYIEMIRAVLTDVLLVGLEWKIAAPQESITFNSKKILTIENTEKYKEKTNSIMRTRKIKYNKKTYKDKDKYYEKNSKHRAENKDAIRQQQRERYKRDKDKINAKRRERRKQKEKKQLLINQ